MGSVRTKLHGNGTGFGAIDTSLESHQIGRRLYCATCVRSEPRHEPIPFVFNFRPCIYLTYIHMTTAKVFRSGNSQALRLPKEFRFKGKEVEIFRRGDEVVLREKENNIVRAFELLAGLPDDFDIPDRHKDFPQKRKGL